MWAVISFALSVPTIYTLSYNSGLSLSELWQDINEATPEWLIPAALCMLGLYFLKAVLLYLFYEILVIPQKRRGFLYASADIYMSFELPCKIMILIGIVIMFLLTVLLILLLKTDYSYIIWK